jgi:hypothetical protein
MRRVATLPVAASYDMVGRPIAAIAGGVPGFVGGLFGSSGSEVVPQAKAKTVAKAPAKTAAHKVAAEPQYLTPEQMLQAQFGSVMARPHTMKEAQLASGLLPAPAKALTPKDVAIGKTMDASEGMYANQIAQAQALEKTDPEGAKAVAAKATDEYFKRQAALLGFNPMNMTMADMMAGGEQ